MSCEAYVYRSAVAGLLVRPVDGSEEPPRNLGEPQFDGRAVPLVLALSLLLEQGGRFVRAGRVVKVSAGGYASVHELCRILLPTPAAEARSSDAMPEACHA